MAANFHLRAPVLLVAILSFLLGLAGCSAGAHRAAHPGGITQEGRPGIAVIIPSPGLPLVQSERMFPVMLGIDVLESEGFAASPGQAHRLVDPSRRGEPPGRKHDRRAAPGTGRETRRAFRARTWPLRQRGGGQRPSPMASTRGPASRSIPSTARPGSLPGRCLKGLDALVIDLQDIGVRSYTFSSAMKLYAMEACFENNVEVVVLDRPNPLGGLKVDGPLDGPGP